MPQQNLQTSHKAVARIALGVRRRVLEHTIRNNGGYLSQACSSAEILAAVYSGLLTLGPSLGPRVPGNFLGAPSASNPSATSGASYNGPKAPDLDRFVFSPVHYALVLYAVLIETGRLAPEALEQFNKDGSMVELIGAEHSPGHEVTAGSLAQALSQAAGIALGRKLKGETGRVVVFMSDGELQEGQTYEAIAAAAYHGVSNLVAMIDVNGQSCDGNMDAVMNVEPIADRLRAFGAVVAEVDGHDPSALWEAMATPHEGAPLVIVGRTDPCRGLPLLQERAPKLHYVRFKDQEEMKRYEVALAGLTEEV